MSEAIEGLKPERFWRCFADIARIPRPSGHEERIGAFILEKAKSLGLEAKQDGFGNIVVRKPASPGREGTNGVCLQAHLDMVCEKNADKTHDFLKDPLELVRKGEFLMANGTTLGADNGAGVATCLAIMEDSSLEHGPLEMLFTVEEETGLTGARNLAPDLITSRTLLNLDSEEEGEVFVGCAGGKDTVGRWRVTRENAPADSTALSLTVKGLKGGHSGLDIDKGLGNAIKMLNRVLLRLSQLGARVSSIDGGNMRNAIPRECAAVLYLPNEKVEEGIALVSKLDSTFREEVAGPDPDLNVALTRQDASVMGTVIELSLQQKLMRTIAALPSGVVYMSADIPGLVETSTNVSVISTKDHEMVLVTSQRSSVATRLSEVVETVESIFELGGASVEESEGYPGWKPNLKSQILATARRCYLDLFGKEVEVKAIHAGLECGIIGERIPGMDMISFGPTMDSVHSPVEKIHIDTVEKFWNFLLEILKSAR